MWVRPPRELRLEPGSLHIWRASLAQPAAESERLEGLLSAEEKARCGRMVRAEDRARCAASRGVLRAVLGSYLGEDPRTVSIVKGRAGKPLLDRSGPSIQFNLSHAGSLALIAVASGCRVGIDIECVRDVPEMETILDSYFSPPESACVRSCTGTSRTRAFFRLWTRREAAAKALGIGLFDCFENVTLPGHGDSRSGFPVALPEMDSLAGPKRAWWMRDLSPAEGYAGAVCTERAGSGPLFLEFAR